MKIYCYTKSSNSVIQESKDLYNKLISFLTAWEKGTDIFYMDAPTIAENMVLKAGGRLTKNTKKLGSDIYCIYWAINHPDTLDSYSGTTIISDRTKLPKLRELAKDLTFAYYYTHGGDEENSYIIDML